MNKTEKIFQVRTNEPESIDWATAEKNNPSWDGLTNRAKKRLARNEMFHREYHELCDAITGFRPKE